MEEMQWITIIIILFVIFMAAIYAGVKNYEYMIDMIKGLFEVVIL